MVGKRIGKHSAGLERKKKEGKFMSTEQVQVSLQNGKELATLGGGCFWCLEAVYLEMKGIEKVVSGYCGGTVPNPTYYQICEGDTGHAEVVQLTFDPQEVSYKDILKVFFTIHDPTTLNRQGADVGTQYRSAIFYHNQEQKVIAEETIKELTAEKIWDNPIVTQIAPLDVFYVAEDYHQEYFSRNPISTVLPICRCPKARKIPQIFRRKAQTLETSLRSMRKRIVLLSEKQSIVVRRN